MIEKTDWLDRKEYPFESKWLEVDGGRMHYVDEGQGSPIVFVHGNGTWSFMFRGLIRDLSLKHRCIACDHIGFGLSDKPAHWSYKPEMHARNLTRLIETLNLRDITLVVHDWGGPIGMAYAAENPDRIKAVVVMNSWMWPLTGNKAIEKIEKAAKGPFGKLIYGPMNSAVSGLKKQFVDKFKYPDHIEAHYKKPLGKSADRLGPLGLAKNYFGSSAWQYDLWAKRERIGNKPALLLWGMKNTPLGADVLQKWQTVFPNAKVETFAAAGHFASEEMANDVEAAIYLFMDGQAELQKTQIAVNTIDA